MVLLVMELGRIVKGAIEKQDMLGWQFNTVGVSDGITMGGEGNRPRQGAQSCESLSDCVR